nr:helix-turn-helix domain-containing protein [Massilia genomosp. 1]
MAPHGVIPFDLATACEVFSRVRVPGLPSAYEVIVCGEAPSVAARLFDLHTRFNLSHAGGAHTLIIPGIDDIDAPVSQAVLATIRAAAGLDLCLHLVRRDYGAAVAADAARAAVMPPERGCGQAQFIVHLEPSSSLALQPVLKWMESQLHRALTLEAIAAHAALSKRTLSRRFLEQTGTSPLQWLLGARVRRAQHLLETSALSVEQVTDTTGFGTSAAMRACFSKQVGTSPQHYRQSFRSS